MTKLSGGHVLIIITHHLQISCYVKTSRTTAHALPSLSPLASLWPLPLLSPLISVSLSAHNWIQSLTNNLNFTIPPL